MIHTNESQIDPLVRAAKKFYIDGLSQVEIAQSMCLSRPTVSRMLKKAVEVGIVDIHINDISYELLQLGEQLAKKFGLDSAIVIKSDNYNPDAAVEAAAYAASNYFNSIVKDSDLVGISHGTTVFKMLKYIRPSANITANAVQLQGSCSQNMPFLQGSYIVNELARTLGGSGYTMPVPSTLFSRVAHDLLLEELFVKRHFSLFSKLNIALVGIGTGCVDYEDKDMFSFPKYPNVVSNICTHFLDIEGQYVETEYQHHAIGIPYNTLKAVPQVIAVAVGASKKDAVLSALRSGIINSIITDEQIASYALFHSK